MALFSVVMVAMVAIDRTGRDAFRKSEAESGAWRRAMLGVEHLKRELRGSRVTLVEPAAMELQVPLLAGATPKVSASGQMVFDADPVRIALDPQRRLVATQAGRPPRVLTELGEKGEVAFEQPRDHLVHVRLKTHSKGPRRAESTYEVEEDFLLDNQP